MGPSGVWADPPSTGLLADVGPGDEVRLIELQPQILTQEQVPLREADDAQPLFAVPVPSFVVQVRIDIDMESVWLPD